jgi:hypothetical protein
MFGIIGLDYPTALLITFFIVGLIAVALLFWWPHK